MDHLLLGLQHQGAIMRFLTTEKEGVLVVDVWMDGTSYVDDAVTHVRKRIESCAREKDRPVRVTMAAVLECFDIGKIDAPLNRTYHQAVDKAD